MKRRLLNGLLSVVCVSLLTLAATSALAQSPVINSFSPASGPVSTTVTLSGQNFNAVSSNNAVFFGSARASVISVVGTTTLNVSVPYGADYRNISVINLTTGLAGYSHQPFVPTHTTNSDGSVRPPTTLFSSSNSAPGRSIDAGDLNADGKADLVIANANNTVAILINQITSSISQPNFGSAITLGTPSGSVSASLSLGDMDGDGRLDIIVVFSGSNVVTVYRNTTSTPGASPSFASAATFTVGNSPVSLNWGDLDADGKPDVVVACALASNNVYVLHNASTVGAISFTGGQVFSAGGSPSGVAIGNIDQDANPDVAISNLGSNNISLFRNVSSIGSISLSAPISITTGTNPAAVVIVDLDGDGLQELVTANAGSDDISAFLNTSSLGSFSFGPRLDYSTGAGSAPSCIALGTILGKGAIDMIVVNPGNTTGALVANVSTLGNIAFGGGAGPVPATPASVKIMDFNADDRPDIAVSFAVPTSNVGILLQRIPQTLIVTSTPSLSVDEMFTTSVTTTTPASQGTFQYNINNYTGSAIVDSNGIITGISAGMVTFTVTSYGDTDYADAQVDQLVTINRGTPTLTFTSPDTMQVGDNLTAAVFTSATYGRGGAITFSIAEGSGSATVDENTGFLTAVKAGTVTLTAMSPGDGDYVSATADQLIVITKITPTINITSANSMLMDEALTITINSTATFSSGGPLSYTIIAGTGSATVNQATGVILATGVGDITLTVTSLGDSNYYSAETSMLITISGSVPTVVISSTNTLKVDESIQVSLSSTASQDIGPLNYSILNGSGSAIVDGNGLITGVSVGDITLTVSSPGNANYQPFSIDQYIVVHKNTPTLSFLSPDNALIGDIINVVVVTSATYGRGGTITYTLVAGSGSATLDINTNELTTRGAGTVVLMAYAPGDLDYNTSFGSQTITIGKVTPTLALIAPSTATVDQSFTASITTTASITSGGNVSFSVVAGSGSGTVNPVTGLFTALSIGTVTLTANSAGDTNYYPTSVSTLITIGKGTPTLTINAPSTLIQGESATISANTTAGAGGGGAITFGVVAGSGSATINPVTGLLVPISLGTVTLTASAAGDTNYLAASASVLLTIVNSTSPPSIAVVSPLSGPIGSSVVIYGQNFSNNPANNVVYFGGVKATVTGASVSALTVTVPSGASYRYISVTRLNANSTAYSPKPFIVTFKSSGSLDFASDGTTTVSGALVTSRMALGDLNGDGKPDLIVIDNNAGTNANTSSAQPGNSNVYVFLNTSTSSGLISYSLNNTLSLPFNNGPAYTSNHATSYAASFAMDPAATDGSNNVSGISLADMDGDGMQDVVITFKNEKITGNTVNYSGNCTGMTVYITTYSTYKLAAFRNTTSNGSLTLSFGSPSLATFEGATDNAIVQQGSANVNGNAFCDPFSPGSSGGNGRSIRSWYSQTSPVTPNYLPYGRNITVADFDGDGKPDVAIARELTNTVSIYRNTSSSTTLSFANSQIFQVGSNSSYDLAAGDLDNDGKADLIVVNTGLASVSILKNQSTPGTLSFNSVATLTVGANPQALALGDFDGDGKLDIAVANNGANSLSLFRNTNSITGTISFPGTASITIPTNSNPSGLALADMDGDGKVDLTVENTGASTVQLFKNTTVGTSLSFTNGSNFNTGLSPQGIVIGDMNADGKPDLAVTNASTGVSFLRNVGTFAPIIASFSPTSGPVSTTVTITGSGFNSTANKNVVFFGATQATVTGASSSSLTVVAPYGANYQYISVTNLDYNTTAYSAKPFVITFPSNIVTEIVVGGTITSTSDPQYISLGDLNGDGKPDMVVANHISSGSAANVYLNTSASSGVPSFSFNQALSPGQNFVGASVLKDIDGDGKLDITLTAYNNGQVAVYRNLTVVGSASLTFAPVYSLLPSGGARYVTVDDFDGDGRPDIAVSGDATSNTPTAVSIFRNLSSSGTISFGGLQAFGSATGYCLASGDLDNDGRSDIVVTHIASGVAFIFRNISTVGAISFTTATTLTGLSNPLGVVIGDFDQDNKPDIAIANSNGTTVSFFLNNNSVSGTMSFNTTASFNLSVTSNPNMLSIGDLNGDGKIDLAVAHTSGSTSLITNVSSVGSLSFTILKNITTGSNTYGVAVGDLNSDGLPDILATGNGAGRISIFSSLAIIPVKVTSFSPANGPISTSVTISGSNFNTTLSKNVVFFGSTQATVTGATSTSLTVTVPYGANYQYISVTNLDYNTTGYSARPFGVTFSSNGVIDLALNSTISTANANPRGLALADFNGDGKPDLLVSNDQGTSVSVYRNTSIPSGALAFGPANIIAVAGARAIGVNVTDFDGDGLLDFIVAGYDTFGVQVFRNTTTQGAVTPSFSSSAILASAGRTFSVNAADFDGDGRPDIIASNINISGNTVVSIFRNISVSGTLSFGLRQDVTVGTDPVDISIADLDNDGKPDVAVPNQTSGTVSLLHNTSVAGTINLGLSTTLTGLTRPNGTAIGDLDGDGKPDLVVGDFMLNSVSFYLNKSSVTGVLSFTISPVLVINTGAGPTFGVRLADMDGDGKADLVVANQTGGSMVVLRNSSSVGNLNFTAGATYNTGTGPENAVVSDLNSDGKPDIVVVNYTASMVTLFRNTTASAPATIVAFSPGSGPISTSIIISGANFNAIANRNAVFFGATRGVVTGATSTSITVIVPAGASYQYLSVTNLDNNITAYSSQPFVVTFPNAPASLSAGGTFSTPGGNPRMMAMGDLNGDGKTDFIVGNDGASNVSVYLNNSTIIGGSLSFVLATNIPANGARPQGVAIGDFDGDGMFDIVVADYNNSALRLFRNTTTPGSTNFNYTAGPVLSTVNSPWYVAFGDFDGDGRPDLVSSDINGSDNQLSVFRNLSSSGTINFASRQTYTVGTRPVVVTVGDLDQDGKVDIAVACETPNAIYMLHNTSVMGIIDFAAATSVGGGLSQPRGVALGDLNHDGKMDIAVSNASGNSVSFYLNTNSSSGTLSFPVTPSLTIGTASEPVWIASTDMNGDGKIDLVVAEATGNSVAVLTNVSITGSLSFTYINYAAGTRPENLVVGDMNGDSFPDIIAANFTSGDLSILAFQKLSQAITITSPNIAFGGSLTASATTTAVGGAGGAITFSLQAGSGSATINPNTGVIHMIQAGTVTLTASTAGDTNYLPASASQLLSLYYSLAGVDTGIKIWLRADAGVSTSGSNVSRWDDQSGNITNTFNQATPVGGPSSGITLNGSGMNYNPVLTFSGASGKELTGTSSTPFAGTSTIIAVARNAGTNFGGVFVSRTAPMGTEGPGIATSLSNNTGGYSLDAKGYVSSETPANPSPAVLVGQYSNTYTGVMYMNGVAYVNNFSTIGPANATVASTNFEIGGRTVGNINSRILAGDIAEVAFFDHPLTAAERTRIQSYLAIKYGIALDAAAEPDYLASDGSVIWQGSSNLGYDNARLAIGVDNASGLYQRQSRSTVGLDILSFGIGSLTLSNSANVGSFAADKSFLIVGNNGALTSSSTSTDVPSNVQLNTNIGTRASRIWKVQNTGNVGVLELQFDLTGAFSGTVFNSANLALLIDKNGSAAGFADETVAGGGVALSSTQVGGLSSSIYKFAGITLGNGDRFTVGLIQNIPVLTITSASTMTTGSTLTATVSTTANSGMGGAITYSITAGSGSATVDPTTGAILATRIGTVTLTARSVGDASYSSAATSQLITISKGTPTLIITSANAMVLGQATMTTFVTSAVGGGTITYSKIDGNPGSIDLDVLTGAFTATQPGSVTLTVTSAGTNDYYATTASQLIVIARATPTLTFLSPGAMGVGDSLTVSVTTTATNGRGGAITYSITAGSGSATVNPTTGLIKAISQGTITLTVTSAGDTYYTSVTISQLIIIGRGAQTLTITSSNMIPYLGTLTATVSTTASSGRGGAITYSIVLGSGSATINPNTGFITTMGAGTFTLTAYAAGDSDYLSASTSQEITIQAGVQSLTITSATTMFVDQALTATITRSLVGGAGGPIVYSIMAGSGSASVDANSGVVKAINAGTVSLIAEATGDANYGPASTTLVINISKISQTLTITGPLVMQVDDLTPATVLTTATGGRGGSYSYTITNGTGLADVDVGGSVLAIVVGQVTLTVQTLGDSNYYGASTSVLINIIKSSPTLTVISGNQVLVDGSLTTTVFTTATFARGGALTYSLVAGSGSATVNALGVVRGLDVGTVVLLVSSAGDNNYYPGSTSHTITVNPATPTLVVSSANALPAGTSLTVSLSTSANGRDIGVLNYSVSGGSGSATVSSNGLLTAIAGGTVVLTVTSAGNANYYPGVGTQTITIGRVTPTLTVISSNTMVVGEALTASVFSTAASGLGGAYSFSISGGSGSATVDSATGVINAISAGMITLTVNSAGDTSYYPTSTTQLITINGGAQTLTVTSANTVMVDGLLNVTVNTTATSGRGGAFSYAIQNDTGSAIVSPDGVITGISVGTITLTVTAAGDSDYSPASVDQVITVMKATPTLTVTSSPAILVNTALSATVNSSATFGRGGALSYSIINGTGVATVDANGVISATQIGSITLLVSSAGDADYYPATTSQDIMVVSVALSNLSAVSEGSSISVLLSLVPSTALLNTPITITVNANSSSTANPAHYSVPSQVFFQAGQNSVSIPFTALSDKILYNDELVVLDFSSPEIGTLTGAITITDGTSLDPNNLFITIGNAIIHQDETVPVTVSLPDGVTSLVPIDVTLSVSQASVLHLSSYTLPTTVTIAAGSSSATFDVSAVTNDPEQSILIIAGSAVSSLTTSTGMISVTYTVRSGIVIVSGQQLSINQAYHRGDPFEISGLAKYPDNRVRVFNVLSNGVFEITNYNNQSRVFRGYGPNGETLPEGNYYVAVFYYDDRGNPHTYVNFFYLK